MAARFGLYEVLLVLTAAIALPVAAYAWRRRDKPGAIPVTVVLLASVGWVSTSLLGSLFRGTAIALISARLTYAFVPVVAIGIFAFAVLYTNREDWLGPRTYAILGGEVLIVNVLVWTNDVHGLWWSVSATLAESSRIGWDITFGPAFWGHVAFSYILIFAATVWLVQFALSAEQLYQRQVFGILVSLFAPWAGNVVFLSGVVPVDLTPIAFSLTGIGLAWSMLNAQMLDITPIARNAVMDTIGDGVLVVDTDGIVVDTNPAAIELLNVSSGRSLAGNPLSRVLPQDSAVQETYGELMAASDEQTAELQLGEQFFTVEASPLRDVRGEMLGTVFVIHDVTEQKRRELELERRNEQLDRFASVVSHDLRNPLNVASGRLDLARETGDDEHLERVETAHQRMETLIEDLLELAKEGDDLSNVEPIDLEATARNAWQTVETNEATFECSTDATTIEADEDRLRQLFENLFRNAIDHATTTPDASDLAVTVETTDNGFAVSDDGPGIPPEQRASVFELGYTEATDGTGFGLAIVEQIADAHGWSIVVTDGSVETGGARFEFTTDSLQTQSSVANVTAKKSR